MLLATLDRFERFFQASSDCQFHVRLDPDGQFRYTRANAAALAVAGVAENDVIGRTPAEVLGPNYGSTVEKNVREAAQHREPYHFRGHIGADATGPMYDAYYYPLLEGDGAVSGVIGSARDITEIMRLSASQVHDQKLEILGEVSAGVAHDFNSILSSFEAVMSMLAHEGVTPEKRAIIIREGRKVLRRGQALTKRLARFARKERLLPIPNDLAQLIQSCAPLVQRVLGSQCGLRIEIADDLWLACCDESEFEIVLLNLATNARDAMASSGRVTISARNGERTGTDPSSWPARYVEVTFTDTGCGMPPEVLSKATEPFFTTKAPGAGTGLGLSNALKFANDVGGAVRITSEVGAGTAVSLLLPKAAD